MEILALPVFINVAAVLVGLMLRVALASAGRLRHRFRRERSVGAESLTPMAGTLEAVAFAGTRTWVAHFSR